MKKFLLVLAIAFSVFACNDNGGDDRFDEPPPPPPDSLNHGDSIVLGKVKN